MNDNEMEKESTWQGTDESESSGQPAADHATGSEPHNGAASAQGKADNENDSGLNISVESAAEEQQTPSLLYPVVGFGASAGGLQAFKEILENLDPQTGMAFVLVTHLAPDQKSFLSEII